MRRLFAFVLGVMLALTALTATAPQATAQTSLGPRDLGFAYANDYNKWVFRANGDIAAGASIVTIQADGFAVTPGGRPFYPLATNAPVIVDQENSSVAETVTPSAVTCTQNSLSSSCTFSATFTYAHRGFFTIRSATFGIQEAINDILNVATGGTVVVANGSPATATTLTVTVAGGNNTTNLLDTRAGAFQFYAWNGSTAYAKSTSPFNSTTAAGATVTAKTGAAVLYTGATDQTTNHAFATVANAANAVGATIDLLKTRTTNADGRATTAITTGDDEGVIRAYGADGTNFIESSKILFDSTGTVAATRVAGQIKFFTSTDAAPSVLTQALLLDADQSATFAGNIYQLGNVRNSATAPDATVTAAAVSPSSFTATTGSTNAQYAAAQLGANAAGVQDVYFKTRATTAAAAATTTVVSADVIAQERFFGADGTNYVEAARIEAISTGTIAATRVPGKIVLSTGTDAAPTVLTAALTLDKDQSALFGGNVYAPNLQSTSTALDATVTAVAPLPRVTASGAPGTNAEFVAAATGASATGNQIVAVKTRATTAGAPATTTVVTADDELVIRAFGADGTNYIESASVSFTSTGTVAATRVPGKITFKTGTDAAPTVMTTALIIDKDQSTTPSGGLKTATANSGAAGFQTLNADTGSPAAGTTGTNTTGIANQLWYTQIFVPYNMTITNAAVLCGGTCTTDKIAIGIYTTDGQTLLKATAATVGAGTVLSGANTWQKLSLTATVSLSGPAKYIVGVVTSGTTAGDIQTYPLANGPVCAVQTSMGTLATAFTPATTGTAASCPYVVLN